MNLKNILISVIIVLTIIAGLTFSVKNYANTALNEVCKPYNNLFFCNNNSVNNSKSANKNKIDIQLPVPIPNLINNPVIVENKEENKKIEEKKLEEALKKDLKNKETEIVKTKFVEPNPQTTKINTPQTQTISKVVYPNSQEYWDVFEGFDFSGKMKQIYNSENHEFIDNSIILRGKKELTSNPLYSTTIDDQRFYTKTAEYAGAKLMLKERFHYGHIQFKAKIPNISGTLPAVWLLNQDVNNFTEVDLLEVPGSEKNRVYGVTHYGANYTSIKSDNKSMYVPNLSTQFHTYDMYKTPEKISVFIDGKLLYEKNVDKAPKYNGINGLDQPLQLIINLNIGDGWAGPIDDSQLPVAMTIKDMFIEKYQY